MGYSWGDYHAKEQRIIKSLGLDAAERARVLQIKEDEERQARETRRRVEKLEEDVERLKRERAASE